MTARVEGGADTAVILAAGFGSRLGGDQAAGTPKPLIPVLGTPVIFRTITGLERCGCRKVVIVLGFAASQVRGAIEAGYDGDVELVFVENETYDLANGVSVLCAALEVGPTFLLTMADHVFDDSFMVRARAHRPPPGGATLLVDYKVDTIFDMDDATKVLERDGKILSIGKEIKDFTCIDTGLFVCTTGLLDHLDAVFVHRGDVSLSEGVQSLAAEGKMTVLDVGDGFWQDVDTPEMLRHAEQWIRQSPGR